MRRVTRGILLNLALLALTFVLFAYWTRAPRKNAISNEPLAWSKVRYKTKSSTLPHPRGVCPGLEASTKPALVVAAVTSEPVSWLADLHTKYHTCLYTADAPTDPSSKTLQVPENRGKEAMAYLTFLIDNYAHIPAAGAVFVHGARWAWHNDHPTYDNADLLASLNMTTALKPDGYHNLRCDWAASSCAVADPSTQGAIAAFTKGILMGDPRVAADAALARALAALFGGDEEGSAADGRVRLQRSETLRAQCCSQFVVSQQRVWKHSREEYVALRQWLLDLETDTKPADNRFGARVMSFVWHILFLPQDKVGRDGRVDLNKLNALACPKAADCYCRLYGRCKLQGCTEPGRCKGQYRVPPGSRLPDNWAAKHS